MAGKLGIVRLLAFGPDVSGYVVADLSQQKYGIVALKRFNRDLYTF